MGKRRKKAQSKDDLQAEVNKYLSMVDMIFDDTDEIRRDMSRHMDEYAGNWWDDKRLTENDSKIFVNHIFASVMQLVPLMTDNRPIWHVTARLAFLQRYIDLWNRRLEYLWDLLEMDKKVSDVALSMAIMKKGLLKIYFNPDEGTTGEVCVELEDPRTFFVAPGYDDLWSAPLCGTRKRRPMSWIEDNYPEKADEVKPDRGQVQDEIYLTEAERTAGYLSDNKTAVVYDLWVKDSALEDFIDDNDDKKTRKKYPNGRIFTFTQDSVVLDDRAYPYEHGKPPWVEFSDYNIPFQFWGFGEAEQIEELNRSTNRAYQLLDRFITLYCDPNWLLDARAGIDEADFMATYAGGGNVYEYNGTMGETPVSRIDPGELPQAVFAFLSSMPRVIELVTGHTDISKGLAAKKEEMSATEASTMIESSYTRTRWKVRGYEGSLKRVLYLMLAIGQQYYTEKRTFPMPGIFEDKEEDEYYQGNEYYDISNNKEFVSRLIDMNPNDTQRAKDMEEFLQRYGDVDEIYADFDLTIETNTTLPMDMQSKVNMYLRLAQMKILHPKWIIKLLKLPEGEEMIADMEKQAATAAQAKAGPKVVPGPESKPPQDLSGLRRA